MTYPQDADALDMVMPMLKAGKLGGMLAALQRPAEAVVNACGRAGSAGSAGTEASGALSRRRSSKPALTERVRPLFMDQWPENAWRHAGVLAVYAVAAFWLALALTRKRFAR
jgi:hypothetical protein